MPWIVVSYHYLEHQVATMGGNKPSSRRDRPASRREWDFSGLADGRGRPGRRGRRGASCLRAQNPPRVPAPPSPERSAYGAGGATPDDYWCLRFDFDRDGDVDCVDWYRFVKAWTEPGDPPVPAECPAVSPAPAAAPHDARKNRYVSFDPGNTEPVAFQIELTSMKRCSDDLGRSCRTDEDCPPETGSCIEHPHVGSVAGWVGEPDGNDVSRVVGDPVYRVWSEPAVHVGDCKIIPVATYELRATADGVAFTAPLEVGTIGKPGINHYGDVVGDGTGDLPPLPGFTPPNLVVNVTDVQAVLLSIQGPSSPSAHTTWVDLHGLGDGVPPNYILNVADLQRVLWGIAGQHYLESPEHLDPGDCP